MSRRFRRLDGRRWLIAAAVAMMVGAFLFFDVPTAVTLELMAAWIAFAVLLVDRELMGVGERTHRLSVVALFVFSFLLHWALSSGGPGDLKMNLATVWAPWSLGVELRWGPAPIALFRLLGIVLGGVTDAKIVWCNLILSSVVPVLLYAIVVRLGVRELAALGAAFVAAAHPLLIAVSGVLDRQPTYLVAACGSILALLAFLDSGDLRQFAAFILGAGLATASRPEGGHVLIVHAAVLLFAPTGSRRRGLATLGLAVLALAVFVYVRYAVEYGAGLAGRTGMVLAFLDPRPLLWTVVFSPDFTPLAWIVIWIAGLVIGARRRSARVAIATVVGVHVAWAWLDVYSSFVGYDRQVASARYETILLIPFAIGMAIAIESLSEQPMTSKVPLAVCAAVLSIVTFWRPYETLLRPFTIDYEYRFLKKEALALPPDAHVYVLDAPVDDVGFVDAWRVARFVGSRVTFALWSNRECETLRDADAEAYLYIGSACAPLVDLPKRPTTSDPMFRRWIDDCTAIRAGLVGSAVDESDAPARKMSWYDFKEPTVRLGLYRLTDPSICGLGWRAPSRSASG